MAAVSLSCLMAISIYTDTGGSDASSPTIIEDGFLKYIQTGSELEVVGVTEEFNNASDLDLVIPKTVQGLNVTKISNNVFDGANNLKSVTMEGITEIGMYTFKDCTLLESVSMPSISTINDFAFNNCKNLKQIDLGNLTTIGRGAFFHAGLESVTVPSSLTTWSVNGDKGVFENCGELKSAVFEDGCKKIGAGAFAGCASLMSVILPESIIEIKGDAFRYCVLLTSVKANNVTIADENLFSDFTNLIHVEMNSLTVIKSGVFRNCSKLTSYYVPDGVTSIGDESFQNCSSLGAISVPNTVKMIGNNIFKYCTLLKTVSIRVTTDEIGTDTILSNYFNNNHWTMKGATITNLKICGSAVNSSTIVTTIKSKNTTDKNTIEDQNGNTAYYSGEWKTAGSSGKYAIGFDLNYDTFLQGKMITEYSRLKPGETVPIANRAGYVFAGWFTERVGGINVNHAVYFNKNFTAYAHWYNEGCVLVLNGNGGTDCNTSVMYEGTAVQAFDGCKREGYTLKGYYATSCSDYKVMNADNTLVPNVYGFTQNGKWIKTGMTTLFAQWEKVYGLNLEPNMGGLASQNIEIVRDSFKMLGYKEPTSPTGYFFRGYYTDATDGELIIAPGAATANKNVPGFTDEHGWISANNTLYGHWDINSELTCTVKYLLKNETPVSSDTVVKDLKFGSNYTAEAPYFAGFVSENNSATIKIGIENTIIFYYRGGEFTISLSNGGQVNDGMFNATFGSPVLKNYSKPDKPGWTFLGYWTAANEGYKVISEDNSYVANVPGFTDASGNWIGKECLLFSKWENPDSTRIVLDRNGTTVGSVETYAETGKKVSLFIVQPIKYMYEFMGYYTSPGSDGILVIGPDGAVESNVPGITDGDGSWICDNKTLRLYAQWRESADNPGLAPNGKIVYHANEGFFEGQIEKVEGTSYIKFDKVPTREGYKFVGWSEAPNAKEAEYLPTQSDITAYNNIDVYPVWAPVEGLALMSYSDAVYTMMLAMTLVAVMFLFTTVHYRQRALDAESELN